METIKNEQSIAGSRPAIVEHFSIEGLYGYRSIALSSRYAATVLIAKNGSGKTTLLGALDAFLKGQFSRLSNLQFQTVTCRLRGLRDTLVLSYDDMTASMNIPNEGPLISWARRFDMEPAILFDFIENDYHLAKKSPGGLRDNDTYELILQKMRYIPVEANKCCDQIFASLRGRNENVDRIRNAIESVVGETEIVYLPTYRRIELPLSNDTDEANLHNGRKKRSIQSRLGITKRGLFNADIRFGLSDILERLSSLNQSMLISSNQGYREISANIINDLISGILERETPSVAERPSKEALILFFSRLKEGRNFVFGDFAIPDIDKIYNGNDIPQESNKFLTYFLSKLNTVIAATRNVELVVEDFITNCNKYLSGQDSSTAIDRDSDDEDLLVPSSSDEKILKLDRMSLRVYVESISAKRRIHIDSLSSGEKQMISLFARLYLYPGPKIILIDEPELSLSIDWQRKILPDVINAPSCEQVIAITHSPFIFDNDLEPFARPLTLKIDPNVPVEQFSDGDDLHE